jgi:hypothetical protein
LLSGHGRASNWGGTGAPVARRRPSRWSARRPAGSSAPAGSRAGLRRAQDSAEPPDRPPNIARRLTRLRSRRDCRRGGTRQRLPRLDQVWCSRTSRAVRSNLALLTLICLACWRTQDYLASEFTICATQPRQPFLRPAFTPRWSRIARSQHHRDHLGHL